MVVLVAGYHHRDGSNCSLGLTYTCRLWRRGPGPAYMRGRWHHGKVLSRRSKPPAWPMTQEMSQQYCRPVGSRQQGPSSCLAFWPPCYPSPPPSIHHGHPPPHLRSPFPQDFKMKIPLLEWARGARVPVSTIFDAASRAVLAATQNVAIAEGVSRVAAAAGGGPEEASLAAAKHATSSMEAWMQVCMGKGGGAGGCQLRWAGGRRNANPFERMGGNAPARVRLPPGVHRACLSLATPRLSHSRLVVAAKRTLCCASPAPPNELAAAAASAGAAAHCALCAVHASGVCKWNPRPSVPSPPPLPCRAGQGQARHRRSAAPLHGCGGWRAEKMGLARPQVDGRQVRPGCVLARHSHPGRFADLNLLERSVAGYSMPHPSRSTAACV